MVAAADAIPAGRTIAAIAADPGRHLTVALDRLDQLGLQAAVGQLVAVGLRPTVPAGPAAAARAMAVMETT